MASEFWRIVVPYYSPADGAEKYSRRAEEMGWDGVFFGDSQNHAPDAFVSMTLAARATSTIRVGTGVTNSVTRHAAVMASSSIAIQAASGGRLVLGIGRGDSAVHQLGRRPMPVDEFSAYLDKLQAYLRGDTVLENGFSTRIKWLDEVRAPKVPVSVGVTGPRMAALAARIADRVTFASGADPQRLRGMIDLVHQACAEVGRDPASLGIGAYIIVATTDDIEAGREAVRPITSIHTRFSAMHGAAVPGMDSAMEQATLRMVSVHTEDGHGRPDSPQAQALDEDFIDRFAIVGPPKYCAERIQELQELGLGHFYVLSQGRLTPPEVFERFYGAFAQEVLPLVQ